MEYEVNRINKGIKIEAKSDKIKVRNLITIAIDSNFDAEYFEGGNIYFLTHKMRRQITCQ